MFFKKLGLVGSLAELSPLSSEFVVQICKLSKEPFVWADLTVTPYLCQGLDSCHVLTHHQVGQDARAVTEEINRFYINIDTWSIKNKYTWFISFFLLKGRFK